MVGVVGVSVGIVLGHLFTKSSPRSVDADEIELAADAESPTLLQAREFVIPIIDFEDTTIQEAVEFLRAQTRRGVEIDGVPRPDPLNFVVVDPNNRAALLSIRLRDIRLDYLCERIAQVAGIEVSFDQDAIVFTAD